MAIYGTTKKKTQTSFLTWDGQLQPKQTQCPISNGRVTCKELLPEKNHGSNCTSGLHFRFAGSQQRIVTLLLAILAVEALGVEWVLCPGQYTCHSHTRYSHVLITNVVCAVHTHGIHTHGVFTHMVFTHTGYSHTWGIHTHGVHTHGYSHTRGIHTCTYMWYSHTHGIHTLSGQVQ